MANPDPLLVLGLIVLGAALGALLTTLRSKAATSRIVREEIERARPGFGSPTKKAAAKEKKEVA
jgi:hypothetical protein